MPSHGLTTMSGAGSMRRAPSFSCRVKNSWRLRKRVFRASLRSSSVKSPQIAMQIRQSQGCSRRLSHPMNKVSQRRGRRLVKRKFSRSCWEIRVMVERTVIGLSRNRNSLPPGRSASGSLKIMLLWYIVGALVTLLALRSLSLRLLLSRAKHPSLGGHARIARLLARLVRYYEYDETQFFNADDAPTGIGAAGRAGFTPPPQPHAPRVP